MKIKQENVYLGIKTLIKNSKIKNFVGKGLLKLMPTEYNLKTGLVSVDINTMYIKLICREENM